MSRVTSKDGTSIAYDLQGRGPAVILVGGGLDDGSENAALARVLARHHTVYNYSRRGRADSGDTLPYAVDREIEDLDALIAEVGGSAHLYGVSSGGALVLEAAAAGSAIDRIALYEVPYSVGDEMARRWQAYIAELGAVLADGRRGDAVEHFMRFAGSSDEEIAGARGTPMWPGLEAVAPTLAYDAACLGDGPPPRERLARITQPTLVLTSGPGMDPHLRALPADFFEHAADAIAASIPNARRQVLDGQSHVADPTVSGQAIQHFFAEAPD